MVVVVVVVVMVLVLVVVVIVVVAAAAAVAAKSNCRREQWQDPLLHGAYHILSDAENDPETLIFPRK